MTIITDYFAFGTTLANMVNLQLTTEEAGVVISPAGGRAMPLMGGVRVGNAASLKRGGFANGLLVYPSLDRDAFNALVLAVWGDFTTAKKAGYISMIGEDGYYSPFSCVLERPYLEDHYGLTYGLIPVDVRIPVMDGILQSVTKTSNFTRTTAERLVYGNTAGGNITDTLFAAASATPYTIYSAVKTSASNTYTIDPNSSETISGASTLALTALNARADFYSDGTAWHTI